MSWWDETPESSGTVWKATWYNRKRSRPNDVRFFSSGDVAPSFMVNGRPTLKTSKRGTEFLIFYDKAHQKWSAASSHLGVNPSSVPVEHQRDPEIVEATAEEAAEFYDDSDESGSEYFSDVSDYSDSDPEEPDEPQRIPPRRIMTRSQVRRSDVGHANIIGSLLGRRTQRRTAPPDRYNPSRP